MAMTFRNAAVIAVAALLAACGTTGGTSQRSSGTSVTRFHLGSEIARGEVSVEPRFTTPAAGGVYEPGFGASIGNELATLGFKPAATPATSEFIATVDVATNTMLALQARAPGSPAIAGVVARPTAVATQLAVQLKRRSDGSIIWEGRAQSPARTGAVASSSDVQKLARALFKDFPGESGRTISVR